MKIGIDARLLNQDERTGVERYWAELFSAISNIDKENEYFLYYNYLKDKKLNYQFCTGWKYYPKPIFLPWFGSYNAMYNIWPKVLKSRIEKDKVDIFHGIEFYFPDTKRKSVVTIHDLFAFIYVDAYSAKKREMLKSSVNLSDVIIAISDATKADIMKHLRVDEKKIKVVHLAASSKFTPINDRELIKIFLKMKKLPEKFILYTGTVAPRKNIKTIIDSLSILKKKTNLIHKLLICGFKEINYFSALKEHINRLNLNNDVIFLNYVTDNDLVYLYNAAEIFVFPSFYEGFGLPVLEAMACGSPVVSSSVSSLPEVIGDAGILVNPASPDELADSINKILINKELRESLHQKSLARASLFSWDKTAKGTIEVYKELLN